ncbi:hypothetical protein BED22_20960 [Escherichia coli]|nr:hypothetical protein [Escherichia coli]
MLPSETMIWQPEFTDKTLSRKPGAVHFRANDFLHCLSSDQLFYICHEIFSLKGVIKKVVPE